MFIDTLTRDFPEIFWKTNSKSSSWWFEEIKGCVFDEEIFSIKYSPSSGDYFISIFKKFSDSFKNSKFWLENSFLFTSRRF